MTTGNNTSPPSGLPEGRGHLPGTSASPGKGGTDTAGVVRWLVLGFVALVFIVMFRGPIGNILGHASVVTVGGDHGVKIVTTATPLGPALVSATSVSASTVSAADGIQGTMYVSRQYGFQMKWPSDGSWTASETAGAQMLERWHAMSPAMNTGDLVVPLVIVGNMPVEGVTPNVNVTMQSSQGMNIDQALQQSAALFQQQGLTVVSSTPDTATQSGFITLMSSYGGQTMYQFQRVVIASGHIYWITATQVPPGDDFTQSLKDDLLGILNSFQPIVS